MLAWSGWIQSSASVYAGWELGRSFGVVELGGLALAIRFPSLRAFLRI